MNEIEEVREEIEHEATKVFYAHCAAGGGWAVFSVSLWLGERLGPAVGIPGIAVCVGGSIATAIFLVIDGWWDADDAKPVTLHGRIRSLRKKLRRLEEEARGTE